jgi:hypothetical protein
MSTQLRPPLVLRLDAATELRLARTPGRWHAMRKDDIGTERERVTADIEAASIGLEVILEQMEIWLGGAALVVSAEHEPALHGWIEAIQADEAQQAAA